MSLENSIPACSNYEAEKHDFSGALIDAALAPADGKYKGTKDVLQGNLIPHLDYGNSDKRQTFNFLDYFSDKNKKPGARQDDPWWMNKHKQLVKQAHEGNIDMLFLGDSITDWMNVDLLHKQFGDHALNFGIAGDKTEDLLWRLRNGELEIQGKNPRLVVLLIGTNNLSSNTDEEIDKQVDLNIKEIRNRLPDSKILLLGMLPRDEMPNTEFRKRIIATNELYQGLADEKNIFYADIGKEMLEPDGRISAKVMYDFLHPTQDEGYSRMYNAIKPYAELILSK